MLKSKREASNLPSQIGRIAAAIAADHFPTGQRAALRRMSPGEPLPLAFLRFALRVLPDGWDRTEASREDWSTIVAGIALMSPGAHQPNVRLGAVLAEAGFSEARLERLLASRGSVRRLLLLRAARFLAAKNKAANWNEAARMLLTRDEDRLEELHLYIASHFYRAVDAQNKEKAS